MKIAHIGASGRVGSRILAELSNRGHAVTAIARVPAKITSLPGVTAIAGDIEATDALAQQVKGHDLVTPCVRIVVASIEPRTWGRR